MVVNIGDKPSADFTQPIELLKACHRRIEHFLWVLQTALTRFGKGDLNDEGRRALEASLNYFANFAPRHTADEEESLFPRIRGGGGSNAPAAMAELDRLESDHRRGDACHALVHSLVRQWLDMGRIDERGRVDLRAVLDELTTMYASHIRLEEERVFQVAAAMLTAEQLREIGEEMKRRRSLVPA